MDGRTNVGKGFKLSQERGEAGKEDARGVLKRHRLGRGRTLELSPPLLLGPQSHVPEYPDEPQ